MKQTIPLKFHNPLHTWVSVTWYATIKLLLCHNKINCIISMILIYCYSLGNVGNFFKLFIQSSVFFNIRNSFYFALQLTWRLASRIKSFMRKCYQCRWRSKRVSSLFHFILIWEMGYHCKHWNLGCQEHVSFLLYAPFISYHICLEEFLMAW